MDETTKDAGWEATRHGGMRRSRPQPQVAQLVERHADYVEAGSAAVEPLESPDMGSADPPRAGTSEEATVGFESLPAGLIDHDARAKTQRRWALAWRERLGLPTCPYVIRWRLETPLFSIRLHHWLSNDDPRYRHDHSWSFITLVLKGGYLDDSDKGPEYLRAPALRYRPATHRHTVYPDAGGCWTIIFTGPIMRQYGFWIGDKFRRASKYFYKYGHHPCD